VPRGSSGATTVTGRNDGDPGRGPNGKAQRGRILAAATELIAAHGVRGMTMRELAAACDLNIATLYHYFSSKSDLVGAIVDDRNYDAGLRDLVLPVDPDLAPRARLEAFFRAIAEGALGELRLWRLLVGESLRDDDVALAEVRRLSGALEHAVDRWLADLFPELDDGGPTVAGRSSVTSVVTGQLLAVFLEEMLLGDDRRADRLARRAAATAAVVFPDPPTR
jgi:AcrR family transcriptional regulator